MSLLSHNELVALSELGVITNVEPASINATSIDIHLGNTIMSEWMPTSRYRCLPVVDYRARDSISMDQITLDDERGYVLRPGAFILAQSREVFNLPNHISAEYKLKSSMARIGLEHMNAGWCDAGWHGSVLTMEFKNMTENHSILIRPGDAIGQMIFFRHDPVGDEASYASRGRYNNDKTVSGIKL